jgi:hypothetical protein
MEWGMIVVASPQLIEDIRRASDDRLSLKDAIAEVIHCAYTCYFALTYRCYKSFHSDILFDPEMHNVNFHVDVISNLSARIPVD